MNLIDKDSYDSHNLGGDKSDNDLEELEEEHTNIDRAMVTPKSKKRKSRRRVVNWISSIK